MLLGARPSIIPAKGLATSFPPKDLAPVVPTKGPYAVLLSESLTPSFPQKRESMLRRSSSKWIPAFAGKTSVLRRPSLHHSRQRVSQHHSRRRISPRRSHQRTLRRPSLGIPYTVIPAKAGIKGPYAVLLSNPLHRHSRESGNQRTLRRPSLGIPYTVIPAKAGIHVATVKFKIDARFRGDDEPVEDAPLSDAPIFPPKPFRRQPGLCAFNASCSAASDPQ